MTGFFITSTGTNIGKTFLTTALCHQLLTNGIMANSFKPLISGWKNYGTDTHRIIEACGQKPKHDVIEKISPFRFILPLSPDMAAREENKPYVSVDELQKHYQQHSSSKSLNLIEGVGGVMAPINSNETILDWIDATNLPVILVSGNYLGTLSHTLTALNALASRSIQVAHLVITAKEKEHIPIQRTLDSLRCHTSVPIHIIEHVSVENPWMHVPSLLHLVGYS